MDAIVILASLGRLKAYRMEQTPTRGKKLSLIEDMEFIDAHSGLAGHTTDRSGRHPKAVAFQNRKSGHLSAYEGQTLELEIHRRLIRTAGEEINAILQRERPEAWCFAAAAENHEAILEAIDPSLREHLVHTERVDILKEPPQDVLARFMPPWMER